MPLTLVSYSYDFALYTSSLRYKLYCLLYYVGIKSNKKGTALMASCQSQPRHAHQCVDANFAYIKFSLSAAHDVALSS